MITGVARLPNEMFSRISVHPLEICTKIILQICEDELKDEYKNYEDPILMFLAKDH